MSIAEFSLGDIGGSTKSTLPVEEYTKLITSLHRPMPKYMAMVAATCQPFVDISSFLSSIPEQFWLTTAGASQLDAIGERIGINRMIPIPVMYFAFDREGQGFDTYHWAPKNPMREKFITPKSSSTAISGSSLEDHDYRIVIKLGILMNHWDGTSQGLYDSFERLLGPDGYSLHIYDYVDNTMSLKLMYPARISKALLELLSSGLVTMKPVGITQLTFDAEPIVDIG